MGHEERYPGGIRGSVELNLLGLTIISITERSERFAAILCPKNMDYLTGPLLALALVVVGSILIKMIRDHPRGTGGMRQPPLHEGPAAAEPTPARTATASNAEAQAAQKRTPPA
jgi:hypothetical protein